MSLTSFRPTSRPFPPMQAMITTGTQSFMQEEEWFLDTGATYHLTNNSQLLSNLQPYIGSNQVTVGNGQSLPI